MIRTRFGKQPILLPLAGLLLAGLGGCTPPGNLARKHYLEATSVESTGDLDGAERLYRQILEDHPQAKGAADAGRQLERIDLRRKQLHREEFMPVLHRLRKVVESYSTVTRRMPQALADFDRDDSLFDSDHLAQLIPAGFVAYLQLQHGKENFLIHALKDGSDTGYRVDRYSAVLYPVDRTEFQTRLEKELTVTERKGNLLFVRRR